MVIECPRCLKLVAACRSDCPCCGWELGRPYRESFWEAVALPLLIAALLAAWLWVRG